MTVEAYKAMLAEQAQQEPELEMFDINDDGTPDLPGKIVDGVLYVLYEGNFYTLDELFAMLYPVMMLSLDAAHVETGETKFTYDGSEKTVEVTRVTLDGNEINSFTVAGNKETEAGDYTLVVTCDGYEGAATVDWSISAASFDDAKITLNQTEFTYNGSPQKPEVEKVELNGMVLDESAYSIENNGGTNVSESPYYVTISPTDTKNYTGSKSVEYRITPATITVTESNLPEFTTEKIYDGTKNVKDAPTSVNVDGVAVNVTVEYNSADVINADKILVTPTGIQNNEAGNYELANTDPIEVPAKITPASIADAVVTLGGAENLIYNAEPRTVTVDVENMLANMAVPLS